MGVMTGPFRGKRDAFEERKLKKYQDRNKGHYRQQ